MPVLRDPNAARVLVIGAGSRGNAYARPISASGLAHIIAVCEPSVFKRTTFGRSYIWGGKDREPREWEEFESWEDWLGYERVRRARVAAGEIGPGHEEYDGVDAVIVCVLDEMHVKVCTALAPLGLHVLCEKPLATRLRDVVQIYDATTKAWEAAGRETVFGICHVLRYSAHNVLLRKLVREDRVVGDVLSVEHTEPVGWWHFSHSYVRGNWRREDTSAPSLLTKSCHDIDFLLWLLCSPTLATSREPPHLPSTISSTGSLNLFRKARKPRAAGSATNCLTCPIEQSCIYSAKRLYVDTKLDRGVTGWPVKIVVPDIEDTWMQHGKTQARQQLLSVLAEDYDRGTTPDAKIASRNWFGRCVWESDNDVCDDQLVTLTWADDPLPASSSSSSPPSATTTTTASANGRVESTAALLLDDTALARRGAKSALFHMTSNTAAICERRGRITGTAAELAYDSSSITLHDFASGATRVFRPDRADDGGGGGHGGGDKGLALGFVEAVAAVKRGEMAARQAQAVWLGCGVEELLRSHVAVFAAEEARRSGRVVRWEEFWGREVEGRKR